MAFKRKCISDFIPFIGGQKYLLHDYQIAISGCNNTTFGVCFERLIDDRKHENNVVGVDKGSWIYARTPSVPYLLEGVLLSLVKLICAYLTFHMKNEQGQKMFSFSGGI